jgi:tRNA(Ile)-lysidine synthase
VPRSRLHRFETAVRDSADRRLLFAAQSRVLVALSGGPDSTALVAALAALRDAGALMSVHACHVDHGLRPGSADDGDACEALCRRLGVPLDRVSIVVPPGDNVQAAARRARYAALREVARRVGAERIATGHTRSDQAETVLQRLLRGAGARGLAAIPARRGAIVRPILDRSRVEVLSYLGDRGLSWREDPTNASPRFLRNRIRAEVLPALQALAPGIERRLAQTAALLRADDRVLERLAARATPPGTRSAPIARLLELPVAVRRRAIRRLWRAATGSRRELDARHVEAVLRMLRAVGPRRVALPGGLEARTGAGVLAVERPAPAPEPLSPIRVEAPGTFPLPGRNAAVEIAWAPDQPPPWPLELRTRQPGDRFRPEHGRGGKKLKAWLIDRKVPRARRESLVVLADLQGQVLWIPELEARAAGARALEARWLTAGSTASGPAVEQDCKRAQRLL